jgi:hypothetical protein
MVDLWKNKRLIDKEVKKLADEYADKIYRSLSNSKFTWRTPTGISKEVGLEPEKVVVILDNLPSVIRSSTANTSGELLYATRDKYQEQTSIGQRILSSIKNST